MAVEISLAKDFPRHLIGHEMKHDNALSEQEILGRVKAGDKKAYQAIVTTYMKKAYFIALGYVHNHQDALDISQESFVRAYRRIKSFDLHRPFFPWLYEILKNLSLDCLKRRKLRDGAPLNGAITLQAATEDREMKIAVWKAINFPPLDQKEILLLRYFQQFSYREIAELTGKPVGTVISTLLYARMKLKEILGRYLGFEAKENPRREPDGS